MPEKKIFFFFSSDLKTLQTATPRAKGSGLPSADLWLSPTLFSPEESDSSEIFAEIQVIIFFLLPHLASTALRDNKWAGVTRPSSIQYL